LKTISPAPLFAALILAACHGPLHPPPTLGPAALAPASAAAAPPRSAGAVVGIDLPTDASDVLNALQDSPVAFVARYYRDPSSRWPPLSAREARRLSALGLKIVAVWEPHYPDPAYFSYASGYNDAITAYGEAKAVGQPAGSAIYFAVDFNAQRLAPIERYFRGVAAGLAAASGGRAEYKIGVYGSGVVCAAIKQAGLAQYSWLSNATAWSGSRDYDDWDIRQSGPLADLPFNHDSDEAKTEYGGFRIANAAAAAPYADAGPPAGMPAFGTMAAATGAGAGAAPRTRPSPLPAGS
jgi:hypothetical protein